MDGHKLVTQIKIYIKMFMEEIYVPAEVAFT